MTAPKLARAVAKLLAEEEIDARAPSTDERDRTVDAIKVELARSALRGRRRRWALPLVGVAAAVALLGIGAATWSRHGRTGSVAAVPPSTRADATAAFVADTVRGTVFVEKNGERVALRSSAVVARGSKVVAMDGEAILVLCSGSKIDVEHATTASLVEDGETELVDIERGAVTSTVTKRGATQRFIVRTPDAEVEVRGTVFRVSRLEDSQCGVQTRVHVDEGRVIVRAAGQEGATLEPGGDWVSRCVTPQLPAAMAASPPLPSTTSIPSSLPSKRSAPTAAATAAATPPATASPRTLASSELAAQNALFADAMASKSRGDTASALTSLDFLLQKYPRTPLREAAEAQRMNLVAGTDPARAVGLAQGYLLRFPHGFARADAEKILGASP